MLIEGDQVGANDEQDATSEEREHSATDSKYIRLTEEQRTVAQTLGSPSNTSWC